MTNEPFVIKMPPPLSLMLIKKLLVTTDGTVENEKVLPPSDDDGTIEPATEDETRKSEARPVVAPSASETAKVQTRAEPTRAGSEQPMRDEDVVGLP